MQRLRYRIVPRPRWWPGQERSEPLTMPPTLLVYLACVLMTVGALLFLEVLVPHLPGRPSRPPLGILAKGVVDGSLVGIAAVGLILVYRSSRIINFAHAALGAIAGALVFQLGTSYDLPFLAVLPVGIVAAIGAGALAELMLRRFFRAPRLVVTISTIALAPLVTRAIQTIIQALNPVPPGQSAAQATLKTLATPFPGFHLRLPDSPLAFGFSDVTSLAGSLLLMALVMLFLSRTRLGRAVRASAENPEAAWLLGINIRVATTIVWALAALLSGFASLVAVAGSGINTQGADAGAAQLLPALVAAMVAGMEFMPMAMFVGIWLTAVNDGLRWAYPAQDFFEVGMLAMMLIALFLQRKRLQRRESKAGAAWDAAKDIRPTPKELLALPLVRNARYALIGIGLVAVAAVPWITSAGQTHAFGTLLITVMIVLSLLILTGWTGQVSLGQYAIVAVGAVVGGGLSQRFLFPFWLAVLIAAATGAVVAVALGLPSLRLRGLYLAAVTLALALAIPVTLFDTDYFGWLLPNGTIPRPQLFFIDFNDDVPYYYLLATITLLVLVLTWRFRRSRAGRVLIALRDNEPAAQSAGIRALTSRVTAFAVSGFIAAMAGALLAHQDQSIQVQSFLPGQSINVFLFLVIGGMGSVSGAVLGALYGAGILYFLPGFADLIVGAGAFLVMMARPDGLAGVLYAGRDAVLRVIALRLRIPVPSLFTDYDAEAQRRRVLPIAPPLSGRGLLSLPATQRYALTSWMFSRRPVRS